MSLETYYKDHWVEIEPDRLDRYEDQFFWGERGNRWVKVTSVGTLVTTAYMGCFPHMGNRSVHEQLNKQKTLKHVETHLNPYPVTR